MENKTGKYLKYAIGEILLVVIGILIALQINNWNDTRKLQKQETQILNEIKSDLLQTKEVIETTVIRHKEVIKSTQWLLDAIRDKKSYSDSIYDMFSRAGFDNQIIPKTSSFENLKAMGLNRITNDSIRIEVTNIFQLSFAKFLHFGMGSENSKFNIEQSLFPYQDKYFEIDFSRPYKSAQEHSDTLNFYRLKISNYDDLLKNNELYRDLQLSMHRRINKIDVEMSVLEEIYGLVLRIDKELGNPFKGVKSIALSNKTVDEIIAVVKTQGKENSDYEISETTINALGYLYMNTMGQNDNALKLFKLNTELYPDAFNTYDSYGECLILIGDKENGIKAYKKSLELNPENENAIKVLSELKLEN
jgi:tetratricopeptide (TPR) repeat protein